MDRRINDLDSPEFTGLFTSFKYTSYRLETLQHYGVGYEDESFRRFLTGEPPTADAARDEWTAMIRHVVSAGKIFQRVHIVTEPLSDYLRYEMAWWYGPNAEAGEDVRILPTDLIPAGQLAGFTTLEDYWLFDSRDLWLMQYAEDGKFTHAMHVSDPGSIITSAYWRDAALHHAVPYTIYAQSGSQGGP